MSLSGLKQTEVDLGNEKDSVDFFAALYGIVQFAFEARQAGRKFNLVELVREGNKRAHIIKQQYQNQLKNGKPDTGTNSTAIGPTKKT